MESFRVLPSLVDMIENPATRQRVEVGFVGTPPVRRIERASGVSEVSVDPDGRTVRCLVDGSFQPFLDALRGHEVLTLQSTPAVSAHTKEGH
jgi:hypothetical protein